MTPAARSVWRGRPLWALLLALLIASVGLVATARGDGDPGSDVLVSQNLFVTSAAGLSVSQQVELGDLLNTSARAGMPIRVAIIATPADLGAVTSLWKKPQIYAHFLGVELSLAYRQRLLVVMPNGLGFNWPGHATGSADRLLASIPVGTTGPDLLRAARAAVRRLASASGIRVRSAAPTATSPGAGGASSSANRAPSSGASGEPAPAGNASTDVTATVIVVSLAAIALAIRLMIGWRRRSARRPESRSSHRPRRPLPRRERWALSGLGLLLLIASVPLLGLGALGGSGPSEAAELAANPNVDGGTPISGVAPNIKLSDQFGQTVSLHQFRGKVVILAFTDSECTTICPLTTQAMLDAKAMLGSAGRRVQLLGVDANPKSTAVEDVLSYSQLHGMLHQWRFLTGSLPALKRVWKAYGIAAEIQRGLVAHTPAVYVIDPAGHLRKLYVTQQSYAAVGQLGRVLAEEAAALLPGRPVVRSQQSYAEIPGISPRTEVTVPSQDGGRIQLGPGHAHLLLFFATWDQEVTSIAGHLDALNRYQARAVGEGLPGMTAVDEQTVEPSPSALPTFLHSLPQPVSYPVAIDTSGRLADGYEVQGEPWFVLTSSSGQILWYWQVSTSGWPTSRALAQHVRAALAHAPNGAVSPADVHRELAGSPPPLQAIHVQAGRLLGSESALAARIRTLRGYPIVLNAWASWCTPCRAEFSLLARASAQYGRHIAFLGADTGDSATDARSFLSEHPVSYPSYSTAIPQLQSFIPGGLEGLPTTVYISPTGRILYVHTGQYESQGALDYDIGAYAHSR